MSFRARIIGMCQSKADGGKRCRCTTPETAARKRGQRNAAQKRYLAKQAAAEMVTVTPDAEPQPETRVNPFAHLRDIDIADLPSVTPEQRAEAAVEWERIKAEREKARRDPVNPFASFITALAAPTAPKNPFAHITPEKIAAHTAQSAQKSPQV